MSRPPFTVERLNELLAHFGDAHLRAVRAEKRGAMRSALFDLPRRSLLGWRVKYEHEATFMREVTARIEPEEIGRRMKVPGSRPYYLQLFLLAQDSFNARQQELLELGLAAGDRFPAERVDDRLFLFDTWERISRAYRNDGLLFPDEAGGTQPILTPESQDEVLSLLRPVADLDYGLARRLAATLETFCFVVHGEQRDGIFAHGPYAGENGTVLFLKEFNDLRGGLLPWAATRTRNALDNVVFAYEVRDTRVTFDMFGGIVTEPLEFADRIVRLAVFTQQDGRLRVLAPEVWVDLTDRCREATNELYFAIVDWPQRYRVEYAAVLFANHVKPFLDLAGIDADERLRAAAAQTAAHYVDHLLAGPDTPVVMAHWGATDGPLFWPVVV